MEAVDGGDVGEDPCNHVLRDSSLCELSAKYLQRKKHRTCIQILMKMFPKNIQIWLLFMELACKQRQRSFHVVVYPHKYFLQLWLLKCDQQLDMSRLKLYCSCAFMGHSYELHNINLMDTSL